MGPIGAMSGEDEMDKCGNAGVDDVNAELLSFFFPAHFPRCSRTLAFARLTLQGGSHFSETALLKVQLVAVVEDLFE